MMQGSITSVTRDRIVDRSDVRLPTVWIGGTGALPAWEEGRWLRRSSSEVPVARDATILAMLKPGDATVRDKVWALANAGSRVYALVGPEWGKDDGDNELVKAPRILLRRLPEVPACTMHLGSDAQLWLGGGTYLRLDPAQADSLRMVFLRLFWHDATEEAWSGERQFAWRPVRERPFDVPGLLRSACVRWEPPNTGLTGSPRGALVHISTGLLPDTAPRRLWFRAGPDHHEHLARLVQNGVEVLWSDRELPNLQVTDEGGEVLLPGTTGRLRLRLTGDQAAEVRQVLEAPAMWRFYTNMRIGEADHRSSLFWLPGEGAAHELDSMPRMKLSEVVANSLNDLEKVQPMEFPTPSALALKVCYEWTVVPPRPPKGHDEDGLIGRWRRLDEQYTERLKKVREELSTTVGDRSRIGRLFERLKGGLLGFERTYEALATEVQQLEGLRPSKEGPLDAPKLLSRVTRLERDVASHRHDLQDTERKAKEDDERAKQEKEWKREIDAALRELSEFEQELAATKSRLEELVNELESTEKEFQSAGKDRKKDLDVLRKKLGDERKKKEVAIKSLEARITSTKQRADKKFEFHSVATSPEKFSKTGSRFTPTSAVENTKNEVPEEALPETGSLRRFKGQRYLIIETWEQLVGGQAAATRLNAILVAPENV